MAKSAYLSRKLLNQLKTLESDSGDMLLTYQPKRVHGSQQLL